MDLILTIEEVREALYLDFDYDDKELERLSQTASSFLLRRTGYDFAKELEKEPLAIECSIMYVRSLFFGAEGYNKQFDYSIGLNSLIVDLQIIADEKIAEEESA